MLGRVILSTVGLVLLLSACNSYTPEIHSLCLRDDIGNYVLKWETNPPIEGTLKVYVSNSPDRFDRSTPVIQTDISEGIATYVTDDNIIRKYFRLSFNDKYYRTVGSRPVLMDNVQNLRDLGGYATRQNGLSTRWGKVFRSGKIDRLSFRDTIRLDNLNIKTIIDLRTDEEASDSPINYSKANIVHIPVSMGYKKDILKRIQDGEARKGDGILYMQDQYIGFVGENGQQFAKAIQLFLDKENYPIMLCSTYGKDRAGFLAAILLLALDIPEDVVLTDFVRSNDYMNLRRFESLVSQLNTDAQEAMSVLLTTKESYLELALRRIDKEYGSFSDYLTNELGIDEKELAQLKEIMLF